MTADGACGLNFNVPLVIAVNKAALRYYEHGGKRKRKCHLKFSEESSLQILIHTHTPCPQFIIYIFLPIFRALWTVILNCLLRIFSLCVRVLRLCPLLTGVYRLSNITTQITFWEIIVIQFVCSSKKPIVCLEQKLSGSDLGPIKRGTSLSLMTQ